MKRNSHYGNKLSKKIKIDEGLDNDDFWGSDDDDFLIMATQVAENQVEKNGFQTNSSILPSYNNFKDKDFISSTPGPSKCNDIQNGHKFMESVIPNGIQIKELQERLKKLQTLCESKEGEVTILRTQLKQCKEMGFSDLQKKEDLFNVKLGDIKKELNKVTSELEFKNLENVNLKQKLLSVNKQSIMETSIQEEVLNIPQKQEILSIQYKDYPLQKVIPTSIFDKPVKPPSSVDNSIQWLKCDGPYYILPISMSDNLQKLVSKLHRKSTKLDNGENLEIDYIFPEVSEIINLDQYSLASHLATRHIKKMIVKCATDFLSIVWDNRSNRRSVQDIDVDSFIGLQILSITVELVYNLFQDLTGFQDCLQKEHIRQFEMEYISKKDDRLQDENLSIFEAKNWTEKEVGIQCRQCIGLMAEILPYNELLAKYLIGRKQLKYEEDESYHKYLNFLKDQHNNYTSGIDFLNLILSVVTIIGNLRKSSNFYGFLSSVSHFLSKICQNSFDLPSSVYNIICKITNKLIFARPNYVVFWYLSSYLQIGALHSSILGSLCKNSDSKPIKRGDKKGIMIISEENCTFEIFSLLYRNCSLDVESYQTYMSHLNVTRFISKACGAAWLYYEEKKQCGCLLELNRLSIKIINLVMDKLLDGRRQPQNITDIQKTIIRLSIKLVPKLYMKSLHVIEKDIIFLAQYKVIKSKYLELRKIIDYDEYDIEAMEKFLLNVDDELSPNDSKV